MAALPAIGTLWTGGDLRWLHRLALASFVARGHAITLYHTSETPPEVPAGVATARARTVWDYDPALLDRFAPAPFADMFRLRMIRDTGALWADTDMLCLQPFQPSGGYLLGVEEGPTINNAALALPPDSAALTGLIARFNDPAYVPEWLTPRAQAKARAAPPEVRLQTACRLKANALGPRALTWMLHETGEAQHALPPAALYPVPWAFDDLYFNPHGGVEGWLTDETMGVHLFASRIREAHWRARPHPASWIARFAGEIGFALDDLPARAA
jgi:hypothetical protein